VKFFCSTVCQGWRFIHSLLYSYGSENIASALMSEVHCLLSESKWSPKNDLTPVTWQRLRLPDCGAQALHLWWSQGFCFVTIRSCFAWCVDHPARKQKKIQTGRIFSLGLIYLLSSGDCGAFPCYSRSTLAKNFVPRMPIEAVGVLKCADFVHAWK